MNTWNLFWQYGWLFFIAVNFANARDIRRRTQANVAINPALADGYERLYRRYLIVTNIPWIAIGLIGTTGRVPSLLSFFRPKDGNPYVLGWFALVIAIWVYEVYWLFFEGGAEALATHPGAYRLSLSKPWQVKLLWLVFMAGGVAGMVVMWNRN